MRALEEETVLETAAGERDGADTDGARHLGDGRAEAAVETPRERGGVE